jgi:hypothetical protein
MPTEIYKRRYVHTVDGIEIEIIPLAIKYMKELMYEFEDIQSAQNNEETLEVLCECVRIAMKQYRPEISKSIEDVENNFDVKGMYKVLEYSAGIKINVDKSDDVKEQVDSSKNSATWEELDLAKLETEVFILGIWKNYDELESSISIEELMAILSAKRELDYEEKKFLAALQGVDLEEASEDGKAKGQKEWEDMKARVFSGGATADSNDILALQGQNAKKAGFGIGMGLQYEDLRN